MTLGDLKAVIQSDSNVPRQAQVIYHNGAEVRDDSKTLSQLQIKQDDMLAMLVRNRRPQPSSGDRATQGHGRGSSQAGRGSAGRPSTGRPDAEVLRLQALGNPEVLSQLRAYNGDLASAVHDPSRWAQMYDSITRRQDEIEIEKQREIALLNADPFNVEAQAKIEEMIRQERVFENVQHAMDHTPEGNNRSLVCFIPLPPYSVSLNLTLTAFGRVHMLYIDVEVNGYKAKAFVDSGAQATVMSPDCAEKCGIMRLLDKRYSGEARGVGTAKILGKVHSAQIKIGSLFLPCAFSVLEGNEHDMLLGLDMLKGHQACIDLRKGALVIQGVEVPFLGEAEIPKHEKAFIDENSIDGPSGMKTGAVSGATQRAVRDPNMIVGQGPSQEDQEKMTSSRGSGQQGSSSSTGSQFPPADITKLMDLGFSREEAIHALELAGGDVEIAGGILL